MGRVTRQASVRTRGHRDRRQAPRHGRVSLLRTAIFYLPNLASSRWPTLVVSTQADACLRRRTRVLAAAIGRWSRSRCSPALFLTARRHNGWAAVPRPRQRHPRRRAIGRLRAKHVGLRCRCRIERRAPRPLAGSSYGPFTVDLRCERHRRAVSSSASIRSSAARSGSTTSRPTRHRRAPHGATYPASARLHWLTGRRSDRRTLGCVRGPGGRPSSAATARQPPGRR